MSRTGTGRQRDRKSRRKSISVSQHTVFLRSKRVEGNARNDVARSGQERERNAVGKLRVAWGCPFYMLKRAVNWMQKDPIRDGSSGGQERGGRRDRKRGRTSALCFLVDKKSERESKKGCRPLRTGEGAECSQQPLSCLGFVEGHPIQGGSSCRELARKVTSASLSPLFSCG